MGRPLTGKNKYPFGVDGITVDAAVLRNGTKLTKLKIYGQRSDVIYDLMSADGKTIYPFMQLTGFDSDGEELQITDNDVDLSERLSPEFFCVRITDRKTPANDIGFATRFETNKVNLQDGTVVYAGSFNFKHFKLINVESLTVSPKTLSVFKGGSTGKVTATVLPVDATNTSVSWDSMNQSIAKVDQSGNVTGVGLGKTTIKAISLDNNSIMDTCEVTVNPVLVSSITVSPKTSSVEVGETITFGYSAQPANAEDKSVTWSVNDSTIGTISTDGKLSTLKAGTVTVTCKAKDAGAKSDTATVTVNPISVKSVSFNPNSKAMKVGETYQTVVDVLPANAANKSITYSTSDATIATVSTSGVVTAVKAGSVVITGTAADKGTVKGMCNITVTNIDVSTVTVAPKTASINVGSTSTLTSSVLPANATIKTVSWSVDKPAIATVSSTGVVTGVSSGTAVVTVQSTTNAAINDKCVVTVNDVFVATVDPTSIAIAPTETSQVQLTVTKNGSAYTPSPTYISSDEAVFTVSSTGLVTAVADGTAKLTVSEGTKYSKEINVVITTPTP